jgi:putative SOS response-associated peptidase YedK
MCGRYTLYARFAEVKKAFALNQGYHFESSYNIAPTQINPVICLLPENNRILLPMRWGLIPTWDKSEKPRANFNARSESILEKPSFRNAFRERRCLIVTNGFYEWKQAGKIKQPYRIGLKSEELFAFAGIWERNEFGGNGIDGYCIITTNANRLVSDVHDRMPVIIHPENYDEWLSPENQNTNSLFQLLKPFEADKMIAFPVTPQINKPIFNNPDCIKPFNSI